MLSVHQLERLNKLDDESRTFLRTPSTRIACVASIMPCATHTRYTHVTYSKCVCYDILSVNLGYRLIAITLCTRTLLAGCGHKCHCVVALVKMGRSTICCISGHSRGCGASPLMDSITIIIGKALTLRPSGLYAYSSSRYATSTPPCPIT